LLFKLSTPFVGPLTNTAVNVFGGRSGSMSLAKTPELVIVSEALLTTYVSLNAVGGMFTSVTCTIKRFVTLMVPSVTMATIRFVVGPCASVGVQVITPLVLIATPLGALAKLWVKAFVEDSKPVVALVTVSRVSSAMMLVESAASAWNAKTELMSNSMVINP